MKLAPIVLFVYSRLDHTKKTVEALQKNDFAEQSDLFIISDGYRNEEDKSKVLSVREYCSSINGFRSVKLYCRSKNYGLGNNIISGISFLLSKYDRVIVLEDDIVTSSSFLRYMNLSLDKYQNNKEVMSVSGYVAPYEKKDLPDFFFTYWIECWGWGTWKDRWDKFQRAPKDLIKTSNKELIRFVNVNGTAPDMWNAVLDNYRNKKRTWAIFFHVMVCQNKGLVLFPKTSMCDNIGFDGSGENCGASNEYNLDLIGSESLSYELPDVACVSDLAVKRFESFNRKRMNGYGIKWNVLIRLKTHLFYLFKNYI